MVYEVMFKFGNTDYFLHPAILIDVCICFRYYSVVIIGKELCKVSLFFYHSSIGAVK